MRKGDYVRCMFPFRESSGPGPSSHIVLVFGVFAGKVPAVAVCYTTSQTDFVGEKRPRQLIHVDETKAIALGQRKAFDIDVSRIALLPVNRSFFPEFDGNAVPNHGHDTHVASVVERRLEELTEAGIEIERTNLLAPAPGPGR
ncbi:hypothetical protein [Methylobacterium sp. 285MFTsu5.1]|uniref:hypothetical protein n=1 Tax=Methylobacterium sp. 285MFTsu5.1 TaxID=1172187 RepID=UPI00131A2151|nr:hypothetical protein [Methylobacterium sp. 285MFTsu5.1]